MFMGMFVYHPPLSCQDLVFAAKVLFPDPYHNKLDPFLLFWSGVFPWISPIPPGDNP